MLIAVAFAFHARHPAQKPAMAANAAAGRGTSPLSQIAPSAPGTASSQPLRAVSQLADLTLPAFQAANLRGQPGNPIFEAAMKAYTSQDCSRAVKTLARVPAGDEAGLAARFYRGVCLMHEGDLASATRTLRGVAATGDSPQQEAALYYLAQVALAGDDAAAARRELERTIALRGDFESRARMQLKRLRAASTGPVQP
jgi:hypothetical protein